MYITKIENDSTKKKLIDVDVVSVISSNFVRNKFHGFFRIDTQTKEYAR
jgi:hypothetical protein